MAKKRVSSGGKKKTASQAKRPRLGWRKVGGLLGWVQKAEAIFFQGKILVAVPGVGLGRGPQSERGGGGGGDPKFTGVVLSRFRKRNGECCSNLSGISGFGRNLFITNFRAWGTPRDREAPASCLLFWFGWFIWEKRGAKYVSCTGGRFRGLNGPGQGEGKKLWFEKKIAASLNFAFPRGGNLGRPMKKNGFRIEKNLDRNWFSKKTFTARNKLTSGFCLGR